MIAKNLKRKYIFAIIFGLLIISVHLSAESQTKSAALKGKVRNLTSGYVLPAQKVTLRIYHNDELDRELQTMTNTDGEYGFTNLNAGKEWIYQLHTQYKGVDYISRQIRLTGYEQYNIYNLSVYSIGSDESAIFIEAHHIVMNIATKKDQVISPSSIISEKIKEWLEVTEYLIIQNTGNTSYLSEENMPQSVYGNKVGLKLDLPVGYKELEIIRGLSPYFLFLKPDSIFHGNAIQPGTLTVAFKYLMETSRSIDLSRRLSFDTEKLLVILANPRLSTESDLQEIQTEVKGEQQTYLGKTYKKGDLVNLKVKITPPENPLRRTGIYVLISVLIIGAGFGGYFGYKKFVLDRKNVVKRAQKLDRSPASGEEEYLLDLKTVYLDLILSLDEMRGEGKISDRAYRSLYEETEEKLRYVFSRLE